MTRWGKAGVRLTPAQRSAADAAAAYSREVGRQQRVKRLEQARILWAAGQVIPERITTYLDLNGLEGPGVDESCGVREPAVDLWEVGKLYPSWEQLCALAALCGVLPLAFVTPPRHHVRWWQTSLRFHVHTPPDVELPPPADALPGQLSLFGEPEHPDPLARVLHLPWEDAGEPVTRFTVEALADAAERYGVRPGAPDLSLASPPEG